VVLKKKLQKLRTKSVQKKVGRNPSKKKKSWTKSVQKKKLDEIRPKKKLPFFSLIVVRAQLSRIKIGLCLQRAVLRPIYFLSLNFDVHGICRRSCGRYSHVFFLHLFFLRRTLTTLPQLGGGSTYDGGNARERFVRQL
jgi:ribosomal protein S25